MENIYTRINIINCVSHAHNCKLTFAHPVLKICPEGTYFWMACQMIGGCYWFEHRTKLTEQAGIV